MDRLASFLFGQGPHPFKDQPADTDSQQKIPDAGQPSMEKWRSKCITQEEERSPFFHQDIFEQFTGLDALYRGSHVGELMNDGRNRHAEPIPGDDEKVLKAAQQHDTDGLVFPVKKAKQKKKDVF